MMDRQSTTVDFDSGVALESVLTTDELTRRPSRPPDYETENRALVTLAQALADSPRTILQKLTDVTLEVLQADSTGISLLTKEDGGKRFYWPAIAGVWKPHIGGGTPRDFGPCGVVLDRNAVQLFAHPERFYPYLLPVSPPICECLLVPFYVEGRAAGTIWAIAHDERRKFDAEDVRQLVSLSRFASSAQQAVASLDALEQKGKALSDLHHRKDEFLAMLSHELRNPLAPLANAVHLLRLQPGSDNRIEREARAIIERQVGQLKHLVDDLLDVSRITTGRVHLRRERLAVAGIVERAVETARSLVEQRRHDLTVSLPPHPIWVYADAGRLEQVVVNLLTNAAKYTDEGGRILLSVEREGDGVVLRVRDTGIGIAPELLPRIFDLFTQAERSLDRSQGGLGIGLCLVQRLVEMHGGTVEATSVVGEGSEFAVRLPPMPNSVPPPPPSAETPRQIGNGCRVLVVDDNVDAAASLAMLLSTERHDVRTAHDGPTALEAAREFQPAVVLLDMGLPGFSGLEVAKQLRREPLLGHLVLIAMTGYGQDSDRERSQEAGFDHHLVKPADFKNLQRILTSVSEGSAPTAA